jgi:hypothetical protein
MYNILEEPTLYHGLFIGDFSRSQENFEDFLKEYLKSLGYEGLKYTIEYSFADKSAMMHKIMIRDMCKLANCEEDEISIKNTLFRNAYNDVLNSFIYVFGKYFYFNIPSINLFAKISLTVNEYFGEIINGDGEKMVNILYNILEPYFAKVQSDYIENNGYLMKPQNTIP